MFFFLVIHFSKKTLVCIINIRKTSQKNANWNLTFTWLNQANKARPSPIFRKKWKEKGWFDLRSKFFCHKKCFKSIKNKISYAAHLHQNLKKKQIILLGKYRAVKQNNLLINLKLIGKTRLSKQQFLMNYSHVLNKNMRDTFVNRWDYFSFSSQSIENKFILSILLLPKYLLASPSTENNYFPW